MRHGANAKYCASVFADGRRSMPCNYCLLEVLVLEEAQLQIGFGKVCCILGGSACYHDTLQHHVVLQ